MDVNRLVYIGLLGMCVAAMIQFIERERDSLDLGLHATVYCFCVAIPLLVVGYFNEHLRSLGETIPPLRHLAALIGCLAAVLGLAAMFFHLGWFFGLLFLAVAGVALLLCRMR
ncbi:MAG: hypothetical protein SNJ75_11600 [Gemmataceae bacterium]